MRKMLVRNHDSSIIWGAKQFRLITKTRPVSPTTCSSVSTIGCGSIYSSNTTLFSTNRIRLGQADWLCPVLPQLKHLNVILRTGLGVMILLPLSWTPDEPDCSILGMWLDSLKEQARDRELDEVHIELRMFCSINIALWCASETDDGLNHKSWFWICCFKTSYESRNRLLFYFTQPISS